MNSKLLEEAIVDAEALREAALKNAEQAILEKYAPEVKNAIASLLEQEELPGMEMPMEEPSEPAPQIDATNAALDGEKLCPCPDDGDVVTFSLGDLKKVLSDLALGNKVGEEEPMDMAPMEPLPGLEAGPEVPPEEEEEPLPAAPALQEELEISEDLIASILSESEEEVNEEVELVEEQTEEDVELKQTKALQESLQKKNSKMLVEQKKYLKENRLLTEKLEKLLKQNEALVQDNKNFKETALKVSQRLEETNLLNAKLYYKNQALGSDSLNERQKNKIVEAVSKAGSVDEVKMIYETLCNAVGSFDNRGPQSLSEAVEKKGGLTLKPRQENNSNSNPVYSKWQKIAGIKK